MVFQWLWRCTSYTALHHYSISYLQGVRKRTPFSFKVVMSKITHGKNSYFIDKISKITYNKNS